MYNFSMYIQIIIVKLPILRDSTGKYFKILVTIAAGLTASE